MSNKISFSAIAAMAAFSMVSLTACGDENSDITGASGESALSSSSAPLIELSSSSGESGDSVQVYIEGVAYSFPACNAEREGTVEKLFVGNPKYGSDQYFKCEQGSWNMKSAIDIECNQANAKIGDICSIDYVGYLSLGGPIRLSCYVYTENGWTYKGYDDWYDPAYAGTCEELLNAPDLEKECTDGESAERTVDDKVYHYTCSSGEWQIHDIERPVIADTAEVSACPAESEGMYETVLDTIAVYGDGNIMEWTSYYHCESGKWVKSDCRDPLDACTADNEGEMKNVVCSQQPGNPKAPRTEWDFVCKNKKWEKLSAEESKVAQINARCTKDDTKIGDICSIVSGGNVAFGIMPNVLNCYVYTEEGWVLKANGRVNSTCEELVNAPADSAVAMSSVASSSSSMVESSSSSSEKKIKCYETDGKIGDVCADAYPSYVSQLLHGGITAGPIIIDCYIYTEKGWNKMGGTLEDWWEKMGYSRDSLEGDLLEGDLHICKEYAAVYEKCAIEEPITGDTCSYEVDGEVYYYFFKYDVWSKNKEW